MENLQTPLIGAHVSASKKLALAVQRGIDIGCEAIQIFTRPPQRWAIKDLKEQEIQEFREAREQAIQKFGTFPVIAHDIYLSNMASPKPDLLKKSLHSTTQELKRCHRLGVDGLVVHLGAHTGDGEENGLQRYAESLVQVLQEAESSTHLLLETCAGQGTTLGYKLEHLAYLLEKVDHPRLGVCWDTCHLFVAGYDLSSREKYHQFVDQFSSLIGLEKLKAVHANDAQTSCGSKKDRHDHIGQGEIGPECFKELVNDSRLGPIPLLIETPEMESMHQVNVATLKDYRS